MNKRKRIVPNVIRGGVAIPLGANYFYMNGRKHEQGGIDIGKDLEVEGGELIKVDKNGMTIVSDAPIMNGISPAQYVLGGLQDGTFEDRFRQGFKYQEKYKDVNGLKDDGTKAFVGLFKKKKKDDVKTTDDQQKTFFQTLREKTKHLFNDTAVGQGFQRIRENDSPTKEQSEKIENDIAFRQSNFIKTEKQKGFDSTKYFIPYDANKAGIPFRDALGLAVEETKMGAVPNISTEAWVERFTESNGRKPTNTPVRTDFQPLEEVVSIAPELATTSVKDPGLASVSGWTKGADGNFTKHTQTGNNKVSFLQANPNFLGDAIGAVGNVGASLISYFSNKKMLEDLEAPQQPYALQAAKLKTNININPQVQQMRRTIDKYNRFSDKNTASSQTAVGRRRLNELSYLEGYNQLYGSKENQETQLINQDRLNQQEVAKYNLENYNNWLNNRTTFKNTVREKQSENTQALVQNLSGTMGNFLNNNAQWNQSMANIAAMSAAYPDVTPELMYSKGIAYPLWLKQRNARRAAKQNNIG